MLSIKNLSVHYGGIQAVQGIDLEVPDGKIVSLIGANGAGKSTTLKTVVGLVKASEGSVLWNGEELVGAGRGRRRSSGAGWSLFPKADGCFPISPWTRT
jgi:branched-chain amino acid transport system ATP-binding protein